MRSKLSVMFSTVKRAWIPAIVLLVTSLAWAIASSFRHSPIIMILLYCLVFCANAFASIAYYGCLLIALSGKDATFTDLITLGKRMWKRAIIGELIAMAVIFLPIFIMGLIIATLIPVYAKIVAMGWALKAISTLVLVLVASLCSCVCAWIPIKIALWKVPLLIENISAWNAIKASYQVTDKYFWRVFLPLLLPYGIAAILLAFKAGTPFQLIGTILISFILPVFIPIVIIDVYHQIVRPTSKLLPYMYAQPHSDLPPNNQT